MALILDTVPLYASLDRSDDDHASCRSLIESAAEPLVIPAPVLVEVDYWIHRRLHPGVLVALIDDIREGAYVGGGPDGRGFPVGSVSSADRYADLDIGFVDAAVMAVVERLDEPKLAMLDHRHFSVVRPLHRESIALLPD